jgi:CPA1 family monovalent cation:H+ antiporter
VLAVVTAGLWVGTRCKQVFRHELYIEARAVWEMMEFLLNGLIFILIGFQLPIILDELGVEKTLGELFQHAALISVVVIVSRIIWVYPGAYVPRFIDRWVLKCNEPYPPVSYVFIVGWTGMRGVVSLAAAMALPKTLESTGEPFPDRGMIQFLTFWVIFATLVGQGLTLPFLIRLLGVTEPNDEEKRHLHDNKVEDPSC